MSWFCTMPKPRSQADTDKAAADCFIPLGEAQYIGRDLALRPGAVSSWSCHWHQPGWQFVFQVTYSSLHCLSVSLHTLLIDNSIVIQEELRNTPLQTAEFDFCFLFVSFLCIRGLLSHLKSASKQALQFVIVSFIAIAVKGRHAESNKGQEHGYIQLRLT